MTTAMILDIIQIVGFGTAGIVSISLLWLSFKRKHQSKPKASVDENDPFYLEACKEVDELYPSLPQITPKKPTFPSNENIAIGYRTIPSSLSKDGESSWAKMMKEIKKREEKFTPLRTKSRGDGVRRCTDCGEPITPQNPGCSCGCDVHDSCMDKWSGIGEAGVAVSGITGPGVTGQSGPVGSIIKRPPEVPAGPPVRYVKE